MNPTKETEDGDKSDKWTRHGLVQNVVLLINGQEPIMALVTAHCFYA